MTSIARLIIAAAALGLPLAGMAECSYPKEVTIPDGSTATQAEMAAAGAAVKDYNAAVENYLACLDEEERALGEAVTDEQKKVHTAKHNAAVDALQLFVDRYNEQVRAFKKANGKP